MLNLSVAAGRHRALAIAAVMTSLLAMSACSSKQMAGTDSTEADSPSTQDEEPGNATTSPSTSTGETPSDQATTTAPAAATETTASDVKRPSPFGTTTTTATPVTTAPAMTTTEPPPPTEAVPPATTGSGCVSCTADFVFPYPSFFDVPQLGTEPVRGTGCGADGTLGEIIPDGVWNARSITISASSAAIDVQCVYHGQAGQQLFDACLAEEGPDGCENRDPEFWFVNASSRSRTMPLAASFRRRYATQDGCADPGPGNTRGADGQDTFDSWVYIEQGEVTFALTSCLYG